MTASVKPKNQSPFWLGYLTYVELNSMGTVGGLLLVDRRARPVEFHCSAPIMPSRTQEILYGRTLKSALLCDQIGQSLICQLKHPPQLILTDEPMALPLRKLVDIPLALFVDEHTLDDADIESDADNWTFESGRFSVTIARDATEDREIVRSTLRESRGVWDLDEPIDRIREAVQEAHRAAA